MNFGVIRFELLTLVNAWASVLISTRLVGKWGPGHTLFQVAWHRQAIKGKLVDVVAIKGGVEGFERGLRPAAGGTGDQRIGHCVQAPTTG